MDKHALQSQRATPRIIHAFTVLSNGAKWQKCPACCMSPQKLCLIIPEKEGAGSFLLFVLDAAQQP